MGEEDAGAKEQDPGEIKNTELSWPELILCVLGALAALYVFLVGLTLMGDAFKVLGGKGAGNLFSAADNPVAGLMTGVLSTVLVQSSSTSTSVVVAMVGADQLTVGNGIPIIMGANIGTSVTNTIVAMGSIGNRIEYERAFSGATVHDMFNMLTVLILFPIEVIIKAIQGEGGPLYWLTYEIAGSLIKRDKGDELFTSPIKTITTPVSNGILKSNKYVIYALTLAKPAPITTQSMNPALCSNSTHAGEDCSKYYCVGSDLDKQFSKISSSGYKKLTKCGDFILDNSGEPCGKDKCYLDAGAYYEKRVTNGEVVKDGFLKDIGDVGAGIIGLILSLLLLSLGMLTLTWLLKKVFMGKARMLVTYSLKLNDYLAILIGVGITIIVQSSSVTTSALTPLCGLGVLPLIKMLPLTLGANIGTTCTALIASLVSLKMGAVQIALVHFFFNIFGILIWFPAPPMRRIPIKGAELLGLYAANYRGLPPLYIVVVFVVIPGLLLAVSETWKASVAGGVIFMLILLAALGFFEVLWIMGIPGKTDPLSLRVLPEEKREESRQALEEANRRIREGVASESENENSKV